MIEHKNKIGLIQIIAALLIVNHHTGVLHIPYLQMFTKGGFVVNTIFVYLSGYLLTKSYKKNKDESPVKFLNRRIIRIYPPLHISLLITGIILYFIGTEITLKSILLSFTGFQYYFNISTFGVQLWFISVILVCYLLCIPTIKFINKNLYLYYLCYITLIIVIIYIRGDLFNDLYLCITNDIVYRLLYHYGIFTIGLIVAIKKEDIEIFNIRSAALIILIFIPLFIYIKDKPKLQFFNIIISILIALSLITLISSLYPLVVNNLSFIFILSSITYEIYLIHVTVIHFFNYLSPGEFYTYPMVFIISILLAFLISKLSNYYLLKINNICNRSGRL